MPSYLACLSPADLIANDCHSVPLSRLPAPQHFTFASSLSSRLPRSVRSSHGRGHSHSHGAAHDHGHADDHAHDHAHAHGLDGGCGDPDCAEDHGAGEHAEHDHGHSESAASGGLRKRRSKASPAKPRPSPKAKPAAKAGTAAKPAAKATTTPAEPVAGASSEQLIFGYLNLAADAAHNFTDGLALGAAFGVGFWPGLATTFATLMHEVPHEVGDVAILMQAGFTKRAAIQAQLGTAVAAVLGTVVALATGKENADLLLNFTAGGFVYVATVDVLPALLQAESSFKQTAKEVLAFGAGVGMMLIVMALE